MQSGGEAKKQGEGEAGDVEAEHTERDVDGLASDPRFQDAIATLMREKKLCLVK